MVSRTDEDRDGWGWFIGWGSYRMAPCPDQAGIGKRCPSRGEEAGAALPPGKAKERTLVFFPRRVALRFVRGVAVGARCPCDSGRTGACWARVRTFPLFS